MTTANTVLRFRAGVNQLDKSKFDLANLHMVSVLSVGIDHNRNGLCIDVITELVSFEVECVPVNVAGLAWFAFGLVDWHEFARRLLLVHSEETVVHGTIQLDAKMKLCNLLAI